MKRTISVMLVILIAFSLLSVHRTYTAQTTPTPTQPVHNVNTGLNYTTIQAAIDAPETLDGHFLCCDAGNYTENVHVHKSLIIIGAGPTLAFRIPFEPDDTFSVTASDVTIEGFTIQSVSGYSGVSVYKADNCGILNNVFTGSGGGILLRSSNDNTVSGNEIENLPGDGITLTDSSQGNEIVSNSLNRNHYGIQVRNASNYNVVEDNFVNSSTFDGIKLNWQGSNYAPVTFNNITNNIICHNYDGIFLDYASNNNTVSDNMVSDNYIGIRLRQTNSSTVVRNTVISNSYRGISAESSYANIIDDNFLNNTANAWDNGANTWNEPFPIGAFPPTPINIIGGYFMGGNYWSDNPNPVDINIDGIGDVPYSIPAGSNKDNLPLVTPLPIFIASFVTPEGEPYPFTDLIISNGTWRRTFTNVTYTITQVPINATCTLTYELGGYRSLFRLSLDSIMQPGQIKRFDVYAIDPEKVIPFTPYVTVKEASIVAINQTWTYDEVSGAFHSHTETEPPDKYVLTSVWTDTSVEEPPHYMIKNVWINGSEITPENYYDPRSNLYLSTDLDGSCTNLSRHGSASIEIHWWIFDISITVTWSTIIGIRSVTYNHAYVRPYDITLQKMNGTVYDPEFIFPQFHIPDGEEGDYFLRIYGLPQDYCELRLPVHAAAGDYNIFDVYIPKISELAPFTFNTAAEFYVGTSQWNHLVHDTSTKTMSVNVQNQLVHPCWGYFVLPKDQMVKTLTAYSGNASYRLRELYNYTEQTVGNYTIVAVRIPPEIDRLALNYIVSANNNAIMDVAPLKTVVGQGYSANTNVTRYDGVPAEPINITLYANQTIIGTLTDVTPACGNCTVVTLPWNTTSFAYGNYTISAYAWPVPGETDSSDNNFSCCFAVHVGVPGDINGQTLGVYDGKCDMRDVSYLIICFNSKPNSANWNPNADINDDGTVNMRDISIGILNFNKRE